MEETTPEVHEPWVYSADFALSFILEAVLYLRPIDTIRICPVTTAASIFQTRKYWLDSSEREAECLSPAEMERWGDEDPDKPSPEFLSKCRYDFDFFVSHFEYDFEEDWLQVALSTIGNFREPFATPSTFSNLTVLAVNIGSTTHLLLLIKTATFSSITNMALYGKMIQVTDTHVTILRLTFTELVRFPPHP